MTFMTIEKGDGRIDALTRNETAFLTVIVVVLGICLGMTLAPERSIDWSSFAKSGLSCFGLFLCGLYIRIKKDTDRLSKIIITIGLKTMFGMSMAILFHLMMPRPEPILSEMLIQTDHWFGYDWPTAVAWVADVPHLGHALSIIYKTSFVQIVGLMILLGAMNKIQKLDYLLFTNALSLILVMIVWQLLPNLSQSTYYVIAPAHEQATHLVTTTGYGAHLRDMAVNGLPVISFEDIVGVVAFPSYHMVMAVLCVWFAKKTVLFIPYLILNVAMLPAILIHGAHHVLDLVGGAVVFFAALVLAKALMRWISSSNSAQEDAYPL